jgi:flavin reductase (DIM6/NTAB) family NADH-FMN oxidoreductase RutF
MGRRQQMSGETQVTGNEVAALLLPETVKLVTAYDEAGQACVATIAWVMSISHEPSMLAVSIRPKGRTARAMASSGCFVVNVPAKGAGRAAAICGKKQGVADRFAEAQITAVPAKKVAAPRVAEAVSWLECELQEHRPTGDHELFIARVVLAETRGTLDEHGKLEPVAPLVMGQRGCFGHFEED